MPSKTLPILLTVLFLLPALAGAAPPLPKGAEIRVNTLENVAHFDPQVAVFPDGGFVVVWNVGPPDGVGRYVIHARFFARNGTPTGGEFRLVDRVAGSQFVDQIAADGNGSFLVAWTEEEKPKGKTNVIVRRFDRAGQPLGGRIQANAPHRKSSRHDGVLAVGPDGRFAVAWTADVELVPDYKNHTDSMARIFNAQGKPLTGQFRVGAGLAGIGDDNIYSHPAALALGPGGTLVVQIQDHVAPDMYENYLSFRDSRGSSFASHSLSEPLYCCIDVPGAALAMGADGSVVATWSEWDLMAQRFSPDGTPRGEKFKVGRRGADLRQIHPGAALVAGGTFVIVWQERRRDGDEDGVFGRVFSANGRPLSGDLQISTTSAGYQYGLSIAAARQGPVVAVWTQFDAEGRYSIFARLLSSGR